MHGPVSKKVRWKRVSECRFKEDRNANAVTVNTPSKDMLCSSLDAVTFQNRDEFGSDSGPFQWRLRKRSRRCKVPQSQFRGHHDGRQCCAEFLFES